MNNDDAIDPDKPIYFNTKKDRAIFKLLGYRNGYCGNCLYLSSVAECTHPDRHKTNFYIGPILNCWTMKKENYEIHLYL